MNEMINIGLRIIEDLEHAGFFLRKADDEIMEELSLSSNELVRAAEMIDKTCGYNEMIEAINELNFKSMALLSAVVPLPREQSNLVYAMGDAQSLAMNVLKKYGGDK